MPSNRSTNPPRSRMTPLLFVVNILHLPNNPFHSDLGHVNIQITPNTFYTILSLPQQIHTITITLPMSHATSRHLMGGQLPHHIPHLVTLINLPSLHRRQRRHIPFTLALHSPPSNRP
jgi:hypothetical protein